MRVDDLRIGQIVQVDDTIAPDPPPGRVVGLREKFSRSPALRVVMVDVQFDRPLFPDPLIDETNQLWVVPEKLRLIENIPWTGWAGEADD